MVSLIYMAAWKNAFLIFSGPIETITPADLGRDAPEEDGVFATADVAYHGAGRDVRDNLAKAKPPDDPVELGAQVGGSYWIAHVTRSRAGV